MPPPGDELFRWFRHHGWSVGEVGFLETDGQTAWLVTACRDGETVLGKSHCQAEAWGQAIRQAAEADESEQD